MAQSIRIIEQCVAKLEKMPRSAPYLNKDHPAVMPPRSDVFNALEDMVQTFRIVVHGEKAPPGEVFSSAENPRGELGFYILSTGEGRPYRLRIRSGAFYNLSIFWIRWWVKLTGEERLWVSSLSRLWLPL